MAWQTETDRMTRDDLIAALYSANEKYAMARSCFDSTLALLLVECEPVIGNAELWLPDRTLAVRLHRAIMLLRAVAEGGDHD